MNLCSLLGLSVQNSLTYSHPPSLSVSLQTNFNPPMGANLCSIRRSGVGSPMTAASSGDGYTICTRWCRKEKREGKRELEGSIQKKEEMKNEYMSLEELLLASPGAPSERGFGNGGEFNVSRHGGFKSKVHPTRISQCSSICERSRVVGESVAEDDYSHGRFPICRSESGKLSKKVSFRVPEVSDVIITPNTVI